MWLVAFQVNTNILTVDEGGEGWLSPEHLLLSDMDSLEEALQVELWRNPQHGTLQLGGLLLKPGQTFTVQDLKSLKVRSEIVLFTLSYCIGSRALHHQNKQKNIPIMIKICFIYYWTNYWTQICDTSKN